jgi:hypothetical protein
MHTSRPLVSRNRIRHVEKQPRKRKIEECHCDETEETPTTVVQSQAKRMRSAIFSEKRFYIHSTTPLKTSTQMVEIIQKHSGQVVFHIDLADYVLWPRTIRTTKNPEKYLDQRNVTLLFLKHCERKKKIIPLDATVAPLFCLKAIKDSDSSMDGQKMIIGCTGYSMLQRLFIQQLARLVGAQFDGKSEHTVDILVTESEQSQKYRTEKKNGAQIVTLEYLHRLAVSGGAV